MKKAAITLLALLSMQAAAESDSQCISTAYTASQTALIHLAADRIDASLGDVMASTRALAAEYVALSRNTPPATAAESEIWKKRYQVQGNTILFQSWQGLLESPPAFQAEHAAFYSYNGTEFTDSTFRELNIFRQLTPLIRAAFRSFDFSWSYLTSADEALLIYPFLPLQEAVNNYPPTKQVFYTSADFEHRSAGWTSPYVDLAGAGMMVTVSYPAFDGANLLGVVSHDITLDQLSHRVLDHLLIEEDATAFIVDATGLLIAATHTAIGQSKAEPYTPPWIKKVTAQVIQIAASSADAAVISFKQDKRQILATKTALTGWFVILANPD